VAIEAVAQGDRDVVGAGVGKALREHRRRWEKVSGVADEPPRAFGYGVSVPATRG
jgi:hypothetical protein